ncbi:Vi polysaccharide biosynthesis UDP-N-acetylglucosamine C-6 dehydrogenase TviB [bacterium]|jgi:UDP-N-acetyl-D-galactosamine dehydrogenase|nr:Vi polysaccharide biosynthesis UDP-N-acetylglucosamine C-6 dehydrogenase TviB [bacterium]MDX9806491.1 Vi polysaccharide biosynthesis UDP-N-acetylglucosamine C-6 dehydrogenase TviB [bacterium]
MKVNRICIVGLGYVGLPLAAEFGKKYETIGFDINKNRLEELKKGIDRTLEVEPEKLKQAQKLVYTSDVNDIKSYNFFIVTVPTPVNEHKQPDLTPVVKGTETVAKVLKKGDIVIYESTVYPGCTEEVCVPILERISGLKFNIDFFCGFSPERVNPGDKVHTVTTIKKITSGSTPESAEEIDQLYRSIITAGTHKASSIKVAEAAKVIENSQRDINIAFVNELALIFEKLGIDTLDVLEAAGTKWNFLPFRPGLVGGHCIGVDPYYLTHKAQAVGYNPEVILAGRRINDNMGIYVANKVVKLMIQKNKKIKGSRVLVLGITFKENCPDIRNSRVIDVISEFREFGCIVDVVDPMADHHEVLEEYGVELSNFSECLKNDYDAVVLAVSHEKFRSYDLKGFVDKNTVMYDIKGFLDRNIVTGRL